MTKKRKAELLGSNSKLLVELLYEGAIQRWGEEAVGRDLSLLWGLRCIWGMEDKMPFGETPFRNLGEMLWVAREIIASRR